MGVDVDRTRKTDCCWNEAARRDGGDVLSSAVGSIGVIGGTTELWKTCVMIEKRPPEAVRWTFCVDGRSPLMEKRK